MPEVVGDLGAALRDQEAEIAQMRADRAQAELDARREAADRLLEEKVEDARLAMTKLRIEIVEAARRSADEVDAEDDERMVFTLPRGNIADEDSDEYLAWVEFLQWCEEVGIRIETSPSPYGFEPDAILVRVFPRDVPGDQGAQIAGPCNE